jgi:acetate kinase
MTVLVINSGSSSVKYTLFELPRGVVRAKGLIERIGSERAILRYSPARKDEIIKELVVKDHEEALKITLDTLTDSEHGVIDNISRIKAVGHRVVHGGEEINESVVVDDRVISLIDKYSELAPLHNPPNLSGIMACQRLLPEIKQVAVFDTAYYYSMPPKSYLYGLPYELYKKYGIRKYGFHGTSHRYVVNRTAEIMGKPLENLKIITCHLGNGCSITATQNGKAVDTSMGFTPLEGLLMGTRCGDIDPAVVFYIMDKEKLDVRRINELLNKRSGLLGISGISNDMRDIMKAAKSDNIHAQMAIEVFVHRVHKYIGAYTVAMNGVNKIVFTAGIGENNSEIRKRVCENLTFLGVKIDDEQNTSSKKEKEISTSDSKVKILVVPTNEELLIAQDTMRLAASIS